MSCFGVLEYWSVGKSQGPELTRMGPFITPLLQHSIAPVDSKPLKLDLAHRTRLSIIEEMWRGFIWLFIPSFASKL